MARTPFVPITMGAAGAVSLALDDFLVTNAAFPAGELLATHVHARPSLAVMLEGSFDLRIRGREYACNPGSTVTEPAEERHSNQLGDAGAHVLVVQPDPASLDRLGRCATLFDMVTHRPRGPAPALAWRIVRELRHADSATPVAVEGLVLEMLALVGRQRGGRRARETPPWLLKAQEILHARFRDPPRVAELAREAGVHPDSLARAFRTRFGMSLGSYVRRLRLEWAAARMALPPGETLARIALDAGFADQSHFTRAFKAHTGRTPAEYRRHLTR